MSAIASQGWVKDLLSKVFKARSAIAPDILGSSSTLESAINIASKIDDYDSIMVEVSLERYDGGTKRSTVSNIYNFKTSYIKSLTERKDFCAGDNTNNNGIFSYIILDGSYNLTYWYGGAKTVSSGTVLKNPKCTVYGFK